MANKKGKKNRKKANKKQAIDLTLRLNVELEQSKQQKPRKQRVKRITSRKRQNLREMRKGMMTQAQAQAGGKQQPLFASPSFYGNVKMLNNAALNQFQNQRYSLEQQVRESSAEQKAMLAAGRAEAAQQAAQALATQAQQLADLQKQFGFQSQQLAAVAGSAGLQIGQQQEKARSAEQQLEQAAVEQQYAQEEETSREARLAEVRAYSDERLKEEASQLPGLKALDWSPQAFKPGKFKLVKGDIVKALAFGDPQDQAALVEQLKATDRGKGKTESREKQVQALRLQAKKEAGTPKKPVRGFDTDEEEEGDEEFFSEEERP
eukprot:COSAG06_NODE_9118_length_1981_cov_257.944740_2_plen_320_part_00